MKKIFSWIFAVALLVTSAIVLASCGDKTNASDAIKSLLLQEDGKQVSADFTVPSEVGGYAVAWTSDKTNIAFATEAKEGLYNVTVTRPTGSEVTVKLTATLTVSKNNTASKEFTVKVAPLDVYDFSGAYSFANNKKVVYEDFALDTEYAIGSEKATISWAAQADQDLVAISADGKKAVVTASTTETIVKLYATFTYNGETTRKTYQVTVYFPLEPIEEIAYWYNNAGVSKTMAGWVVAIAEAYSSYGNASFYMIDESGLGGYYAFRIKADATEGAKLAIGSYVTVTGTTNQNYNGLIETNAGGAFVVDESKAKTAEDLAKLVYKMDDDLIANAQSLYYRQSTIVSLTNWKVTEVTADSELSKDNRDNAILKLEKDGVTIMAKLSTYNAATPVGECSAIYTEAKKYAVGDYVSVQGILGYYFKGGNRYEQSGYQIILSSAADIKAGTADTAETAGKAVAAAFAKVTFAAKYTENTEITLPTVEGMTISATVAPVYKSVKVNGNKLVVTPVEKAELVSVVVTFTKGTYSTSVYYSFQTQLLSQDAAKVAEAKEALTLPETVNADYDLPAAATNGATITWKVGETAVTKIDFAANVGKSVALVATITSGTTTDTKEFTVKVETLEKTVTATEAYTKCAAETKTTYYDGIYVISGIIKSSEAYNASYKNVSFVITDGVSDVKVFRLSGDFAATFTAAGAHVGEYVTVKGQLCAYFKNGALDCAELCTNSDKTITVEVTANAIPMTTTDIYTAANALESGKYIMDGTEKKTIITTGVVKQADSWSDKYNNFSALYIEAGENKIQVYGLSCGGFATDTVKAITVGDTITVVGVVKKYNTTIEFDKGCVLYGIEKGADITDAQAVEAVKTKLTEAAKTQLTADLTLPTSVTVAKYSQTITITWKNGDTAVTSIAYVASQEYNLTATITCGSADAATLAVKYTCKAAEDPLKPVIAYTSSTSYSVSGATAEDVTSKVTTSDKITVTAAKNSTNSLGLYTNSIRLYNVTDNAAGGGTLTITAATGYVIKKITITYDLTKTGGTMEVNEVAQATIAADSAPVVITYENGVATVTIHNASTTVSTQVRIASIVVELEAVAA